MGGRGFKFSLLFGIVTCFLSGTGLTAQNSPPTYVNELRGRSALLPIHIPLGKTVAKIKLDFCGQNSNETNQIAEISNGTLECTNACGRFGQRLEMVSETALRINDLEIEDSGVYNAHVLFNGNVYPKYPFYLTVYAPVPQPQIIRLNVSEAPGGFNVTLKCLAPTGREEKIDISWGRGDPISPLEESSDSFLSGNGTILQLFWKPGSSNSTITCQASNAVDQKNASYDLNSILEKEGANLPPYAIAIIVVAILFLICVGLFWKRKSLISTFQKVFCHRNSTPNGTELQEVKTLQSAPLQNGYSKCAGSEPDNISDPPPPGTP